MASAVSAADRAGWVALLLSLLLPWTVADAMGHRQVPREGGGPGALYTQAAGASAVDEGQGPHSVYVFFDPNCAYCRLLYASLQPLVEPYHLHVSWVPVGIVSASSPGKAAAILDARNPLAALAYNESHYHGEEGGIAEELPGRVTAARVKRNNALLAEAPVPVVPTMLLRIRNGRTLLIQGALSPFALRRVLDRIR